MWERLCDDKNLFSLERRVVGAQLRHRILEIARVWPVFTFPWSVSEQRTTAASATPHDTKAKECVMTERNGHGLVRANILRRVHGAEGKPAKALERGARVRE